MKLHFPQKNISHTFAKCSKLLPWYKKRGWQKQTFLYSSSLFLANRPNSMIFHEKLIPQKRILCMCRSDWISCTLFLCDMCHALTSQKSSVSCISYDGKIIAKASVVIRNSDFIVEWKFEFTGSLNELSWIEFALGPVNIDSWHICATSVIIKFDWKYLFMVWHMLRL